jgi:hypothetical protein
MLCQVVQKEFPFRHLPEVRHFVVVEANHESCDEIKFLSKIGQRPKSFDSLDYTADPEKTCNFPEHGQTVHIKTESGMTQQLGYVEEISRAAAKIENALGARQIEFDLANSPNVDSDPAVEIEIFRPVCAGICDRVSLANLLESNRIDCFDNPFFLQRESTGSEKSERMFPRADQAPAIYKLAYFMSKSHLKKDHTL